MTMTSITITRMTITTHPSLTRWGLISLEEPFESNPRVKAPTTFPLQINGIMTNRSSDEGRHVI